MQNVMRLNPETPANTQNVFCAPNSSTSIPPIIEPVPVPRPQYTPCMIPCIVPNISMGTALQKYTVRTHHTPANVNPEKRKRN